MEALQQVMQEHQIEAYGVCVLPPKEQWLPYARAANRIPSKAKSIIVCAFPYYVGEISQANVCRYAMLPDYHVICGERLESLCQAFRERYSEEFVWFCDNSAIPEKDCAIACGLAFHGNNTLAIHPQYGSYWFIGEIVTTLELSPTAPLEQQTCLACGACEQACPTQAIQNGTLDRHRCLSAITQKKGTLTPQEERMLREHGLVWGCDRCQEVCPHNQALSLTNIEPFLQDIVPVVTAENLPKLMKTRAFGYRKQEHLLRNLAIISASFSTRKEKDVENKEDF